MIPYRLVRTVQLGMKSLMLHKLRSGLTMLGIVFGVFSVIAMLAIGEGASNQAQQQVLELGAMNIIVRSVKPLEEGSGSSSGGGFMGSMPIYGLLRSDFERLVKTVPSIVNAIPIREMQREARYLHNSMEIRLVGCTTDYQDINNLRLQSGRFISSRDTEARDTVAVLASETADKLFPGEDPLGKRIQITAGYNTNFYTVIGIMADRTASAAIGGSLSGQDFNKDVYIPIDTMRIRIGDDDYRYRSGTFSAERVELNQITFKIKNREEILPTAEIIRETLEKYHAKKKDFAIVVPLELLRQADQLRQIFNIVLGSIAAISLIVGGIGIMNIMLATVTERTREIGIRRALGARQADIIQQFLTETVVLSSSGGLLGIALGLSTPIAFMVVKYLAFRFILDADSQSNELFGIFTKMSPSVPVWSLPLAFGISVGVGIVFGIYPAQAAAKLDPIEALRHE